MYQELSQPIIACVYLLRSKTTLIRPTGMYGDEGTDSHHFMADYSALKSNQRMGHSMPTTSANPHLDFRHSRRPRQECVRTGLFASKQSFESMN